MGKKKDPDQLSVIDLIEKSQDISHLVSSTSPEEQARDILSVVYDAIESSSSGIIITDNDGIISYVNDAFITMFEYDSKKEILGKNAADFFLSKEIKAYADIKDKIDSTEGNSEEFRVIRKNGELFYVEMSSSEVKDTSENIVGMIGSFVNITKRKGLEEEQKQLVQKLQEALDKIKVLRGLIPICASCKKIRDDAGYWNQIETYIEKHSDAQFSHGLCEECSDKLYGNQPWYQKAKKKEGDKE